MPTGTSHRLCQLPDSRVGTMHCHRLRQSGHSPALENRQLCAALPFVSYKTVMDDNEFVSEIWNAASLLRSVSPEGKPMASLVLIIEDQPLHAKLFTEALRAAGLTCMTAVTGREGLAVATATSPELIIVDILLPDTLGHEIIAELRGRPQVKQVPIIAITAAVERKFETLSVAAGADVFLTKPIRLARLTTEVTRLLKQSRIPPLGF
jgi:two-component system cell cycle response regulator DivK